MERLEFTFPAAGQPPVGEYAHAGVVGSGNLEVMLERELLSGVCVAIVETSISGYEGTWRRVLGDFVMRQALGDVRISINDGGATPAVVMLRLDQAAANLQRGAK